MANTYNTGVYPEEWMTKLQERLDHPTCWREVLDVIYSDTKIFNVPYMSTEPSVTTGTRGTAYTFSDFALTTEALDISQKYMEPVFIDRADLAQMPLVSQMTIAEQQAAQMAERIESYVLAQHASWTDVGDVGAGAIGLGSGAITVSSSNIDDIIRGVKREIVKANGKSLADRNGIFFVWRPADFELIEQFVQANGFQTADQALKNGLDSAGGYYYMGAYHYQSNDFTAGHVFAGVKKVMKLGILRSTYGKTVVTEDPNMQSGVGIVSRIDIGVLVPTKHKPTLFDVNVA